MSSSIQEPRGCKVTTDIRGNKNLSCRHAESVCREAMMLSRPKAMHVTTHYIFVSCKMPSYLSFPLIFTEGAICELVDNTEYISTKDIRIQFIIGREDTRGSPYKSQVLLRLVETVKLHCRMLGELGSSCKARSYLRIVSLVRCQENRKGPI